MGLSLITAQRPASSGNLRRQLLPLGHDQRCDNLHGDVAVVDAFVDLAGLNGERISSVVGGRRLTLMIKGHRAFKNVHDEYTSVSVATFTLPSREVQADFYHLVVRNRQILSEEHPPNNFRRLRR